jgi:transcriptional regulator with XRE-family HTH domain
MKATRMKLSDQIRLTVNTAGVSRYAICQATGLDKGTMSRFMAGQVGLSLPTLNALADVLGLRIVADGPVKVHPRKRAGRKVKAKKGRSRAGSLARKPIPRDRRQVS